MSCNVFLIGKTGAGKSSLLNYLAGNKPLEDSGIASSSKGITKGFHEHLVNIYGLDYVLIDSEGYEVGEIRYWEELIQKKFDKFIKSDNADEAFPVILYCIDGSSNRVVDIDTDTINRLKLLNLGIVPIITKTDICTYEDVMAMCDVIKEDCHIDAVIMTSDVKYQQEEYKKILMRGIIKAWTYTVRYRFPNFVFDKVFHDLLNWQYIYTGHLMQMKMTASEVFKKKLQEEMNNDVQKKIEDINLDIKKRCNEGIRTILELNKHFGEFSNSSEIEELLPSLIVKLQNISTSVSSSNFQWNIKLSHGIVLLTLGFFPALIYTLVSNAIESKKKIEELRKYAIDSFMNTWEQINSECDKQKNKLSEYLIA